MAFTGLPGTITVVSDKLVRITGLSLAKTASGTIGLNGDSSADVQLPAQLNVNPYSYGGKQTALGQDDVLKVVYDVAAINSAMTTPIGITKGGAPFQITITNPDAANASGNLEIWVEYTG